VAKTKSEVFGSVGNPTVEEWADWIVSRHNFCEREAGESLREIALVALRNVESQRNERGSILKRKPIGSDFESQVLDKTTRCSECGEPIYAGVPSLVSLRGGKVMKRVCSEECRLEFDNSFWQGVAEGKETP